MAEQKQNYFSIEAQEVFEQLNSDKNGLSSTQAEKRQQKYGKNTIREQEQKSLWKILLSQINNPVIYLLSAAAAVAFFFGDIPEAIAILVVIVLNTIVGFTMEYQALKSMQALKKMDRVIAKVVRNGETIDLDAENLVPGDVIILESGMLIPADARIFEASELAIDEAPLTGESIPVSKQTEPVDKDTELADRKNVAFKGTAVTDGRGKAVVTGIGMNTQIGNISEMVETAEKKDIPLNRQLTNLARKLIWLTIGLAGAFFIFGWLAGKEAYILFQTAVAWTVAAIPEGLAIVATIALAKGMLRLAKHNVIVKKLEAIETLGETTMIFTDKTGTLTENKLKPGIFNPKGQEYQVNWKNEKVQGFEPEIAGQHKTATEHLLKISVLCNNAELHENDGKDSEGDPLEVALLRFVKSFSSEKYNKLKKTERVDEDPFDSEMKMMGTAHKINEKYYVSAKGAAESILKRSKFILDNDKATELNENSKKQWQKKNDELSEKGLRVLAFAYREAGEIAQETKGKTKAFMQDLTFIGLVGFIDPPRQGVADAVASCRDAGIKVIMVTGDHPGTAKNIAVKVNLEDKDDVAVMRGKELDDSEKDEKQLDREIINTNVFSRVDPKQKLDIVEHYQKQGEIVGMTGDGVNDAPALKTADIGIVMGKRGTQVAQDVADMVLKDDSFVSIVEAVKQGRIIFGNIRKFIIYQLSYHLSEILVIASISFTIFELPLLPLQLLFLNLLSDIFPALALGIGHGNQRVMEHPPKNPDEPILNKMHWFSIGVFGIILTLFVDGAYLFALYHWELSPDLCNNVAFFSLAFAQLWHVFDMRESNEPVFINQITKNKYVWMALGLCSAILLTAYFVPGLNEILSFQYMEGRVWLLIGITSLLPIIVSQIIKSIFKEIGNTF